MRPLFGTSQNPANVFFIAENLTPKVAPGRRDWATGYLLAARSLPFTFRSKQIGEFCTRGDAGGRKRSCKRHRLVACGIVGRQSEPPDVMISVGIQRDMFKNLGPTLWVPDAARATAGIISLPWNVIEEVTEISRLFPNAQAEVSILRGTRGIHDFCPIGMPHNHGVVDYRTRVRNRLPVHIVSCEHHMPHSDNRG